MSTQYRIEHAPGGQTRLFCRKRTFLKKRRRALISYLVQPVIDDLKALPENRFSNSGIARSWRLVLENLGYLVDIINWDDNDFEPLSNYDLVIFHGGKNFDQIYPKLNGRPKIIYFSTGSHWQFHNAQEQKRLADFQKRHDVKLAADRPINEPEELAYKAADGIIALGNQAVRRTYDKYPVVQMLNNANYPDDHFEHVRKDYDMTRKNFLFFAGAGNIHKGLDLLIDSFKDLKEHLYIVGPTDKWVMEVLKKDFALPNIHLIGEVNMRTREFYSAMDKCAFCILPSCSEGQPGSVVEAMNQGLIPIVSRESGLDADRYGLILPKNTPAEIKKAAQKLSALSPAEIAKMAIRVREVALSEHSPEKFRKDLKKAIVRIINSA